MRSAEAKIISDKLYTLVGSKVKVARTKKHFSQESLAKSIGLTRTSVNNIEHGRQKFLLDTLWQISSILDIPIMNLIPRPKEISVSLEKTFPTGTPDDVKKWVLAELVEEKTL